MLYQIIGYTIVVMFVITFGVTIWGLLQRDRIEKKYMNALFGAVVLELAGAFFFLFRLGFDSGGGVTTSPSPDAVYVFDKATGEPMRLVISAADTIAIDSVGVSFQAVERNVVVSEDRDTLFFQSKKMGTMLGYVRAEDALGGLGISEGLLPDQKPEVESYILGLFHGRFDDNRLTRDEGLAALYLSKVLERGTDAEFQGSRTFYDRARQRVVRSLLRNKELTAEDYDVIIVATENLGGNLTKGHDLGEIYLAYAQRFDEKKYRNALESFEEFLRKESTVRNEITNAEEMINNAKSRVAQIRPLVPGR